MFERPAALATWVKLCEQLRSQRLRATTKEAGHEEKSSSPLFYVGKSNFSLPAIK